MTIKWTVKDVIEAFRKAMEEETQTTPPPNEQAIRGMMGLPPPGGSGRQPFSPQRTGNNGNF